MTVYLFVLGYLGVVTFFELFHIKLREKTGTYWAIVKSWLYWGIVLLMILIAGFRYELEEDYWHYYYVFNGIKKPEALEIGFKCFNQLIRFFTNEYAIYCVIVAIISISFKAFYISKIKYPFVVLFTYYVRFYVLFELNAIRQGMALAFVFGAIYYLKKEETKKYLFFIFLGIMFHTSAIIGLGAFFVKKINIQFKTIVSIYVIALFFRLVLFDKVMSLFSKYIAIVINSSNTLVRGTQYIINSWDKLLTLDYLSLIRVIVPGICLFLICDKKDMLYYNLYFVGTTVNVVFWGLDTIAFRLPAVFYIFEGFILNDALEGKKLGGNKKRDWIFSICFLCILFCDMWTFCSYLKESKTLVPYRNIFTG